jgi:beta-lactam-binding protein with PASTA domain
MPKRKNLFLLFILIFSSGLSFNSFAGPFPTPDIVGETEGAAIAIINADPNFEVGTASSRNDAATAGIVIEQTPAAGSLQDSGTVVDYVVSLGPVTTTTSTTTTTTTAAPTTTTTAAPTTTTTAAPTTTTTGATTSTTAAPTTTTTIASTTSTTAATTTTTMVGPPTTTTTGATTTTTTTASTTTTAAATTTTTQVSSGGGSDDDLFDFGGGGCTIGNTRSTGMDPIWLFLLLAPGLGILRRRIAATGAAGTKIA